jgi:GNAT superfamily N-acetyltransferase
MAAVKKSARSHALLVKFVSELTEQEVSECLRKSMLLGSMRSQLLSVRAHMLVTGRARSPQIKKALANDSVIMVRDLNGQLLAWALISNYTGWPAIASFYVTRKYRRHGYGTLMLKEACQRWPRAQVHPWDEHSYAFFQSHPGLTTTPTPDYSTAA